MEDVDLNSLFAGAYEGRRVLVTGHTGFKGSWLALWLSRMGARVTGIALDPEYAQSHWSLLRLAEVRDRRIDICDADELRRAVEDARPEIVFHLAAQALVRRSYREPVRTFRSNVMGVVNILEAIRNSTDTRALVNATTDKVYAEKPSGERYSETDELGGHDPYSTSKACAELVTECYRKSFYQDGHVAGIRVATARAGNVIGGGDWSEDRLVPDILSAVTSGSPLVLRHPGARRPWQHVLEPLSGYLLLGQALLTDPGAEGAWNFGPDPEGEITVEELARRFSPHLAALELTCPGATHPHEAATLQLNSRKARDHLGWRPVWGIDQAIERTAVWYAKYDVAGAEDTSMADISRYVADARSLHVGWAA